MRFPEIPLRGILPPLVTPLTEDGKLDAVALERLVAHVTEAGVHGLFLLGTTGEGPSLTREMRMEIVRRVRAVAPARLPVLVNITHASVEEALLLAEAAASDGASALVFSPPFYFPLSQPELADVCWRMGDAMPLPFFLYNMPSHARPEFSLETVRALSKHPRIAGIKDSGGNLDFFKALLNEFEDQQEFAVFTGPEEPLAEVLAEGAHGGVTGTGNLFPRLFVRLYEAAVSGDTETAGRLQALVNATHQRIYGVRPESSSYLRGLKCALSLSGLCGERLTAVYQPFGLEERKQVQQGLRELETLLD